MATFLSPNQKSAQCVEQFVTQLEEDFSSPGATKFQDYMPTARKGVQGLEESLSMDKTHIHKLNGSLKELFRAGEAHGNCLATCASDLVKFGTALSTSEKILGNNFVKFGTLLNQMASLLTNLSSSSKNILMFPLQFLFDSELKGNRYKSDIKALSAQYQSARNAVEREEKRTLVQAGVNVTDRVFTSEELAGKLVSERRRYQLGVVEYMLKYNETKSKSGVELAEHLVSFYRAQEGYFKDGSALLQALKNWEAKFTTDTQQLKLKQEEEKKRLQGARDDLREAMGMLGGKAQGPAHLDPSQCTEMTDKSGYLCKKPENTIRIPRRKWPKCFCTVSMSGFTLAHSHTHAPHVKIPVIHFQYKDCAEPVDGHKYCFRLIAQTRTYAFEAEAEKDLLEWKQAMQNCQLKLFQGDSMEGTLQRKRSVYGTHSVIGNYEELIKRIITKIRSLPGNDKCADCSCPEPEWLSVNLGILTCINCCGRHRELSVQYSRIRSLKLDKIKTTELLIALVMGNGVLNEVLEANLTDPKPSPDATTDQRQEFIVSKYLQRKYIEHTIGKEALLQELAEAVDTRDIKQLLQVYVEGVDLAAPLPSYPGGMTAMHLAVELEDLTSLHIVDFLLGNGSTENCMDSEGNTPLHLAVDQDNAQCVKLLLCHRADLSIKNKEGTTALDIAEQKQYAECVELLQDASKKKFTKCDHIDVDWGVGDQEGEEEIYQTPVIDSQPSAVPAPQTSGFSTVGGGKPPDPDAPPPRLKGVMPSHLDGGRRRPVSTAFDSRQKQHAPQHSSSSDSLLKGATSSSSSRAPFQPAQPNVYPAPSEPAPPPPPRTVSKTAAGLPVAPKREKKKRLSVFPGQLEMAMAKQQESKVVVEALYDCVPDHRDELGFREGEKVVITKKLNRDWWRGYILTDPSREGVFPVNYVQEFCVTPPPPS